MARNYAKLNDKSKALSLLEENFKKLEQFYGEFTERGILLRNKFVPTYGELNLYDEAIKLLDKSISCFSKEYFQHSDFHELKALTFNYKADFLLQKSKLQNAQLLKTSIETYLKSDSFVVLHKLSTPWQNSKIESAKSKVKMYNNAIEACYHYYRIENSEFAIESAFRIMERTKAFTLLESLNQSLLLKLGEISEEDRNKLYSLKNELFYNEQKSRNDTTLITKLAGEQIKLKLSDFYASIEKNLFSINNKIFFDNAINFKELLKSISQNEMIYIFYSCDSIFYSVNFSNNVFNFKKIPSKNEALEVTKMFSEFSPSLFSKKEIERYENSTWNLKQLLIGEIDKKINSITIIPDGILNYIPFNALVNTKIEDNDKVSFSKLDYLIQSFKINYAYSLTHLTNSKKLIRDNTIESSIGIFQFGDNLVYSKKEYNYFKRKLPKFTSNRQTNQKESTLDMISKSDLVHISLHGKYNSKDYEISFKLSDSVEIYGYDIGSIRLKSKLTFLNSCEGNAGDIINGEGVFSMARSFMQAGCPSVIASIWKIPKNLTSEITTDFYSNLLKQKSVVSSINLAQMNYLNNSNKDDLYKHPYYWAGLIPIGLDQTFHVEHNKSKFRFHLLILVFLSILVSTYLLIFKSI